MAQPKVKMVQTMKQQWNLVGPKGNVMVEGIYLESPYKASEWCKAYISSFPTWGFEVIGLKKE